MSFQLSMNDSQITATGSQKREIQSLGNAFDWNDFSDVESVDQDEVASDDEEEVIDFDETSRDMKEELGKVFYVGAKFKTMEDLREKAQSLGKQFNCPITTARSSKNQFLVLQCRHGGEYRKARKGQQEEQQQKNEKEDEKDKNEKGARRYKTGRKQCPLRIYASVGRDDQNPWEVRQVVLNHNHSLSNDMSTYAGFRKLAPVDFELACSMLKKGETVNIALTVS
ncbi:unnamed protein product [Mucor circinelloides]